MKGQQFIVKVFFKNFYNFCIQFTILLKYYLFCQVSASHQKDTIFFKLNQLKKEEVE